VSAPDNTTTTETITDQYLNPEIASTEQSEARDAIAGISSSLSLLSKSEVLSKLAPADQNIARTAASELTVHRDTLIDRTWGTGWRKTYYDISQNPQLLNEMNQEDVATFKAIRGAMGVAAGS